MQHPSELGGPIQPGQRIVALDVCRGVAVLGILVMNIQAFALPYDAYFAPTIAGPLEGGEFLAWLVPYLLAEGKFITLFSMLFGVGVLIVSDRRIARDQPWLGPHYHRMLVLLGIGLIHAYGFWYGDILVAYALTGMIVPWFRSLSNRSLAGVGLAMLGICSALLALSAAAPSSYFESVDAVMRDPAVIQAEIDASRGSWAQQMTVRIPLALEMHTFGFAAYLFWFVGGMMAIGMALYRWGVLRGSAATGVYAALLAVGMLVGLPLTAFGAVVAINSDWTMQTVFLVMALDLWADLLVALGWIGGIMLVIRSGYLRKLQAWLANVGRLALSNYLLQTLICTSIFYGHGLGLFAQVGRVAQLGIVLVIWLVLIAFSNLWLKRFTFGPAEWLWRRLSYGRPLRTPRPSGDRPSADEG